MYMRSAAGRAEGGRPANCRFQPSQRGEEECREGEREGDGQKYAEWI